MFHPAEGKQVAKAEKIRSREHGENLVKQRGEKGRQQVSGSTEKEKTHAGKGQGLDR